MSGSSARRVAIVGGGLAGLSAAAALVEHGCDVVLLEARRQLGGRAASFEDADAGERIDYCQHVSMGCCTQLNHFCRTVGVADLFHEDDTLYFVTAHGQRIDFRSAIGLPAPLHLLPGLMRLDFLSLTDRIHAGRLLMRLAMWQHEDGADDTTVAAWLAQQSASTSLQQRFFGTVLVSALGETLEKASLRAARKVFLDGFMRSTAAWKLRIPRVPLTEIFDVRAAEWLTQRGVTIARGCIVKQVARQGAKFAVTDAATENSKFDACILAVPWRRLGTLLSPELSGQWPDLDRPAQLAASPITSAHLWFDRPITPLPHAVIVDRLSQWVFNRGLETANSGTVARHYLQVVISASHGLSSRAKADVLAEIIGDLQSVFSEARNAQLLDSRLVTDPQAVFSVSPRSHALRLSQTTPIAGLFLAGDWTATDWPATMEGAVRSGYLAAEGVLRSFGAEARLLVDDLPSGWLARMLFPTDSDVLQLPKAKR
jgi:squalene-associated FAD-dependent desaturase